MQAYYTHAQLHAMQFIEVKVKWLEKLQTMAKRGSNNENESGNPDLVDFKLSKKKKGRFHPPLADSEMDIVTKGFVPDNTKRVRHGPCESLKNGWLKGTSRMLMNRHSVQLICCRKSIPRSLIFGSVDL